MNMLQLIESIRKLPIGNQVRMHRLDDPFPLFPEPDFADLLVDLNARYENAPRGQGNEKNDREVSERMMRAIGHRDFWKTTLRASAGRPR